jgi:hypothetical protein
MPWASSRSSATAVASSRWAHASSGSPARAARPERDRRAHESLLGPVVQVAFEAAPLGVTGGHQAGSRGVQVRELLAGGGLEALVLERQSRRGAQLVPQRRVVEQPRPVDQRPDDAVACDQLRRVAAGRAGRRPVGAHPLVFVGPVEQLQVGVAERVRERVAQAARARRVGELDDEPGQLRPRATPSQWVPGGRHGEEQQRQRLRGPQETVELVVGDEPAAHAVRELHRAQRHEGDGREQHGSLAQSPRRARASEPHDDDRHHDRKAGRAGGEPPPRHRALRTRVGGDHHEVLRALQASLGEGVEPRGGR